MISDDDIKAVFSPPPTDWEVPAFRVDWDSAPTLEDSYTTAMTYDALNRVKQMIYPEDQDTKNKVLLPLYNRAGALEKVQLKDDNNGSTPDTYVEHIAYNAKGQRLLIAYGNGIMTRYTYDTQTFRLVRLKSEGYTIDGTTYKYSSGTTKQDFKYGYDLAGNIVSIRDKAPTTVQGPDDLQRTFEYDALYRLLKATGRECDTPGSNPSWNENLRCHDHTATRTYRREYTYDKMGNILQLKHKDTEDGTNDFTRVFNPDINDDPPVDYGSQNLLNKIRTGGTNYLFEYDANGNQTKENTNRYFEWDHSDQMRAFFDKPGATSEPTVYTHYLYDAAGNRVKKITRNDSGIYKITIYIDGVFEHIYEYDGSSRSKEKNEIHVMDDKSRIAMKWIGYDDSTPQIKYVFEDHLGSSTFVMEGNGSYYNREEYFPFGETSFGSFAKKRYRYVGKEKDEESGLYYYGARYYSAWCCRFVSVDPLYHKNVNTSTYIYANSNPIFFNDPKGKKATNHSNNKAKSSVDGNTQMNDKISGVEKNGPPQQEIQGEPTTNNNLEKSLSDNVTIDDFISDNLQKTYPSSTDYELHVVPLKTAEKIELNSETSENYLENVKEAGLEVLEFSSKEILSEALEIAGDELYQQGMKNPNKWKSFSYKVSGKAIKGTLNALSIAELAMYKNAFDSGKITAQEYENKVLETLVGFLPQGAAVVTYLKVADILMEPVTDLAETMTFELNQKARMEGISIIDAIGEMHGLPAQK